MTAEQEWHEDQNEICPLCNGRGYSEIIFEEDLATGQENCPKCLGHGVVHRDEN